jgi:septal ring factor EnvC (AmiA/AmiB activator)
MNSIEAIEAIEAIQRDIAETKRKLARAEAKLEAAETADRDKIVIYGPQVTEFAGTLKELTALLRDRENRLASGKYFFL